MPSRAAFGWIIGGLAVVAVVAAAMSWLIGPNWEVRSIVAVTGAEESARLDVVVEHEQCGTGEPRVSADEGADGLVRLTGEYDIGTGSCDTIGLSTLVPVELERELGDRTIVVEGPDRELRCAVDGGGAGRCVRAAPGA